MKSMDLTQPVPVTTVDAPLEVPAIPACVLEADTYDVEVLFQRLNAQERALQLLLDGNPGRARFVLEASRLRHPHGGRTAA